MAAVAEDFGFVPDEQPKMAEGAATGDFGFVADEPMPMASQSSLIDRILPAPQPWARNLDLGLQHGIQGTLTDVANLIPGVNIPQPQSGSGIPYNVGNIGGNLATFLGGGELADAMRLSAEGLPLVGKVASVLGGNGLSGVARRALGASAFGALTNPNDRTLGAGTGAVISGAADAVPGVIGLAGKAVNAVLPQGFAEKIFNSLGGGKSLEENAQSLAQDIQNAYKKRESEGNALYDPVFSKYGDNSIYDSANATNGEYQSIDPKELGYDRNLNKLHEQFVDNPTLQNAHNLQSQLGTAIRKLQTNDVRGNLSVADRSTMQGYQDAQGALKNDINTFLTNKNPALADQYNVATQNWAENVTPYLENSKIAPIAKGDITNPRNITNIFQQPEPEIQKIVEDIGSDANNKILYSEIGKLKPNLTAEKLSQSLAGLDNKGLSSYVTPELSQQSDALAGKIANKNLVQRGAGFLLGGLLGHQLGGAIPLAELGGAGIGALLSPLVAKTAQKIPFSASALSNVLRNTYNPASKAVIATALNRGQE